MAKIVDYPRASLKASLMLAQAIDDLGGTATAEMVADKMGKKIGGAFRSLMAAASKFGLVTTRKGRLSTTGLYREYKLAYNKIEQEQVARRAFLAVPLFRSVYERFKSQKLPVEHFEKLLIREFEVHEAIASRVAKYFVDGAKDIGLLKPDFTFNDADLSNSPAIDDEAVVEAQDETSAQTSLVDRGEANGKGQHDETVFSVRITGPGMDSVMKIFEEEDLLIVQAMLKKVEKTLKDRSAAEKNDS